MSAKRSIVLVTKDGSTKLHQRYQDGYRDSRKDAQRLATDEVKSGAESAVVHEVIMEVKSDTA